MSVAAAAAARPPVRYVVGAGDTLSGIAAQFGVRGGWPVLYAANRQTIGPDPDVIQAGAAPACWWPGAVPARYTVAAGDSLSGIAAEFGVRGGWPVLYAANRHTVGPDPSRDRGRDGADDPASAGGVLAGTGQDAPAAPRPAPRPSARPSPAQHPVPVQTGPSPVASGMPGWLRTTLLAVGLLIAAAFVTEPVLAARRRRRHALAGPGPQPGTAQPGTAQAGPVEPGSARSDTAEPGTAGPGTPEAASATAGSPQVAAPAAVSSRTGSSAPGSRRGRAGGRTSCWPTTTGWSSPAARTTTWSMCCGRPARTKAILRVASLVLPECRYGELAEQLGVPATWPME